VKSARERYGVNRWSPPGRLARKKAPKRIPVRILCGFCFQHHVGMRCGSALSSPQQRADDFAGRG